MVDMLHRQKGDRRLREDAGSPFCRGEYAGAVDRAVAPSAFLGRVALVGGAQAGIRVKCYLLNSPCRSDRLITSVKKCHGVLHHAVAVVEDRVMPDPIIVVQAEEPVVQQVIANLPASISWRSLRTEKNIWTSMARNSFSGGIEAHACIRECASHRRSRNIKPAAGYE